MERFIVISKYGSKTHTRTHTQRCYYKFQLGLMGSRIFTTDFNLFWLLPTWFGIFFNKSIVACKCDSTFFLVEQSILFLIWLESCTLNNQLKTFVFVNEKAPYSQIICLSAIVLFVVSHSSVTMFLSWLKRVHGLPSSLFYTLYTLYYTIYCPIYSILYTSLPITECDIIAYLICLKLMNLLLWL